MERKAKQSSEKQKTHRLNKDICVTSVSLKNTTFHEALTNYSDINIRFHKATKQFQKSIFTS